MDGIILNEKGHFSSELLENFDRRKVFIDEHYVLPLQILVLGMCIELYPPIH
jgi:hypothetical protein